MALTASLHQNRFLGCDSSLDVFKAKVQLIDAALLGLAPELSAAKLSEKMAQAFALRAFGKKHRLQSGDVIRQIVERDAMREDSPIWPTPRQWRTHLRCGSLRRCGTGDTARMHA
jgi:hypothetical protein